MFDPFFAVANPFLLSVFLFPCCGYSVIFFVSACSTLQSRLWHDGCGGLFIGDLRVDSSLLLLELYLEFLAAVEVVDSRNDTDEGGAPKSNPKS